MGIVYLMYKGYRLESRKMLVLLGLWQILSLGVSSGFAGERKEEILVIGAAGMCERTDLF